MQFSYTSEGGGKAGKSMLVAGLHVAIGALFIHGIDSRHLSLSSLPQQVVVMDRAAVNALSPCAFMPATSNGVPEAGWAQLAYVWTLDQ